MAEGKERRAHDSATRTQIATTLDLYRLTRSPGIAPFQPLRTICRGEEDRDLSTRQSCAWRYLSWASQTEHPRDGGGGFKKLTRITTRAARFLPFCSLPLLYIKHPRFSESVISNLHQPHKSRPARSFIPSPLKNHVPRAGCGK